MTHSDTDRLPLRVLILAASDGERGNNGPTPRALQELAGRAIIDYVLALARALTAPQNIHVIVDDADGPLAHHIGSDYHCIVQREILGTGHAVLQAAPEMADYEGHLLILYGDTPLFRESSMRGLLMRHGLKGADLTLFSCITDARLPYGRVVRDGEGKVLAVVEEAAATPAERAIDELNLGAYAAQAQPLFAALEELAIEHEPRANLLTAAVAKMREQGGAVDCYRTADEDEVQGINTAADLEAAELILQKRRLRPHLLEEENVISFGTGGWRAVIGEGFTLFNVRRLAQAVANRLVRAGKEEQGVLIGYDHRFLSDAAAVAAAEVLAGNDVRVVLLDDAAPTPLITYATAVTPAAYGMAFTASHNPPEWNGVKLFDREGALLLDQETGEIQAEANRLFADDIIKVEEALGVEAGLIERRDLTNVYVDAIEAQIDMAAIRRADLRVLVDPMHGVAERAINIILTEARCRVDAIRDRRDPLFGGYSPAPDIEALGLLIHHIKEGRYDLGLAMDGDADRIAIVDEKGEFLPINDLLVLVYWYLHEVRGEEGPVVRNLATTHMLDRLAALMGQQAIEVPVGFKHVVAAMQAHNAVLGGESSGGLTIRGHVLGKDGILAAALIVEMLARTGEPISALRARLQERIGWLYMVEKNLPATPEMKALFPRLLREAQPAHLEGYEVLAVDHDDGHKFRLADDRWVLLRFSGTEPLLRIFAEAETVEAAQGLIRAAMRLVPLEG